MVGISDVGRAIGATSLVSSSLRIDPVVWQGQIMVRDRFSEAQISQPCW